MRQEKGQDIAGACGQLALVNPSKASTASKDIEDVAGGLGKESRKGRAAASARAQRHASSSSVGCSGDKDTCQSPECTGSTAAANVVSSVSKGSVPRSTMLCYANVLIPVVFAAVGLMKQL